MELHIVEQMLYTAEPSFRVLERNAADEAVDLVAEASRCSAR